MKHTSRMDLKGTNLKHTSRMDLKGTNLKHTSRMDLKGTNLKHTSRMDNGLERHQFEAHNRLDLHKQDGTNLKIQAEWT